MPTPQERRRRILQEGRHPREDGEEPLRAKPDQPINAPEPRPLATPLIISVLVVVLFVIAIGLTIWARYQG